MGNHYDPTDYPAGKCYFSSHPPGCGCCATLPTLREPDAWYASKRPLDARSRIKQYLEGRRDALILARQKVDGPDYSDNRYETLTERLEEVEAALTWIKDHT